MPMIEVRTQQGRAQTPRFGEHYEATEWIEAQFTEQEIIAGGWYVEETELAGGGAIERVWRPIMVPGPGQVAEVLVWQPYGWHVV